MRQKWNNSECQCECKKTIQTCSCEDYAWNPSKCACDCDKNCENGEYLKECEYIKSY